MTEPPPPQACPSCGGGLVARVAGPWCPRCRGWIVLRQVSRWAASMSGDTPTQTTEYVWVVHVSLY